MDMFDCQHAVCALRDSLAPLYDAIVASATATCAEVVLYGANYDETITYPPFFREHLAPWLNKASDALHATGKFLLTHTDGENRGLLPCFADCRFDIADSVCPAPMTKVTIQEYRKFFSGRTTIWGAMPSSIVIPQACGEEDFRSFVQSLIRDCRPYDHLILSIADTTPPDADFDRVLYLRDQCAKTFG